MAVAIDYDQTEARLNHLNRLPASAMLPDADAALFCGLKNVGTLAVWRCTKRHNIPFVRVGRAVRYRKADLEAWLVSRTESGSTDLATR